MQRPRYRSAMARRVVIAVFASLLLLLFSFGALVYAALVLLPPSPELAALAATLQSASGALPLYIVAAIGAVLLPLLAAPLLARWAVQPADKLITTAAMLADNAQSRLPIQTVGEVGQITRNFSELSELLLRSSRELEKQNKLMTASVGRLEQLLSVGRELSVILEPEPLLRRAANALHDLMEYDRVAGALVEGDSLAFFLDDTGAAREGSPLHAPLHEGSAAGRAALTGAAVRVDDLRAQTMLAASPGMTNARSELAVPVIHARQVLAVLVVQSQSVAAFGSQDEEQLALLAQMLGGALANSSRFRDEQLRRQMAEAIYRVSQTLSGALAYERVPELILDQLAQVLPFDRSALLFVEGSEVETVATRGFSTGAVVARVRTNLRDLPLIGEIVAQGRALALDDASTDQRYRPTYGTAAARSWLGAPLSRLGIVIGVLALESDEPARYGRDELAAMTAIANQAAIALENARLYTEAQERAQRLEVITELTKLVNNRDVLRELHGILRTAVHRIRRIVPCDYAALALYNADDNTFSVEPVYDSAIRDWTLPASERVPADDTPWQMACRTAGPVLQSSLASSAFAGDRQLAGEGFYSSIVVPIRGAKRDIGALTFASREQGAYGTVQQNTLMELAHYLGPALYNAMLNREREAAASQLAQTQEYLNLVDKVRVVGQLASGVAHDFNNLLAGILGNAQLLLYEVQDVEHREMLRVIERAAKDGSETVRRLQGFARMEHDSPMTEVRLDMLARDAIDITRPRWRDVAQSHGVSIEIVSKLEPVTPIAGRPPELREVLTNLIINAVDAMPKGGSITISSYEDPATADMVALEIADSGTGMSRDVQARIFDPFFTTKGEAGTGLGLAVSLGIIEGHGGRIEVDSVLGKGTRFIIRLPVRAPVSTAPNEVPREAPITPGHLLLVESEPMIRQSLVRLLERWGHRVTQATGGVEALRIFQPEMFDVVLSDQGMPDMSGWDLLAQVKQREPRVPTVLMTGWGRQASDDEARERGVDFIIEKPFDQDVLRRVLAEAMD